jgi:hypothetical protein
MGGGELNAENRVLPARDFYPMVIYSYPKGNDPKFTIPDLCIVHSASWQSLLPKFPRCFEAVKRLEYNFNYGMIQPNQEYQEVHVDLAPSELRDAMSHLSEPLEELSIAEDNYRDPQHPALDPGMMPITGFKNLKKIEVSAIVLLGTRIIVRQLDTPYNEEQIHNFVSVFPSSLEHLTIKHCDNAIVEPVMEFLKGELPPRLKTIHLGFSGDSATKPQFVKGQILVERAFQRAVVLTRHILPITPLDCKFCKDYYTRIKRQ